VLNHLHLAGLASVLDHINLMAYDFTGPWTDVCGHHAQLRSPALPTRHLFKKTPPPPPAALRTSCDTGVEYLLQGGLSPRQVVLGVPVYARYFPGAEGTGQGFNKDAVGEMDYCDVPDEWKRGARCKFS